MDKSERFFRVHQLPPYLLGEIAKGVIEARLEGRDIIDLSQLNPNTGVPPAALDKLVQASLLPQNHRYSSSQGITKLRRAASALYRRRFQVELDVEREVVVTLGTKEGLGHLLLAVCSPGDSVLVPTPAYPIHSAAVVIAGANLIGVSLPMLTAGPDGDRAEALTAENDRFFTRLLKAYEHTWPRPVMMIVSFPHNPTTTVVTLDFFQRLVELAREKGFYLIHDFAYADLCYDGYRAPSIMQVEGARDVAVEFFSLSKGLSVPGWRVGFCVGNEKLVAALKKIKSYFDYGVFQPLQIAAISALDTYDGVLSEAVQVYRLRRDALVENLRKIGWNVVRPRGSLFIWAELPPALAVNGSMQASRELLHRAGVAVCPGAGFDAEVDRWVRLALVEPENRLRTAVQSIAQSMV